MTDSKGPDLKARAKATAGRVGEYASRLTRKKFIDADVMETNLRRCLSTADVTLLAIGHMVGSGVYVLAASVSKKTAGPAIVLAFLLSGFASFLAALCYAELGVRFPRAGSAYSYTYLSLGELWAFLVGWNVALEHVIGAAAVSRACSAYIDSLVHGAVKNGTMGLIGSIDAPYISDYLDFLAFGILVLFTLFLSFGVQMTSRLNNVFSVANLTVIVVILCVGGYFSDFANWTNPETGGFMPFGFSGVLAASASCFYAYVGFDSIAASGEEVKDPQKSIPRATMISMGIATATYVGVSAVLTLMVNYRDIHDDSGLPEALASHGAYWAKYVVIVGAVCGMATAIIGSLFALTRVVYVMADDGLLFALCSNVNSRTKIPLGAMYIFAAIAALMTLTLNLDSLVEVMSIGTLFAYMIVSASVIVLRYRPVPGCGAELSPVGEVQNGPMEDVGGLLKPRFHVLGSLFQLEPGKLVSVCVFLFVVFTFMVCTLVTKCAAEIGDGSWWAILLLVVLVVVDAGTLCVISAHEQSTIALRYKVPLVPLIPALSVAVNALLIVNLKGATWLRLLVWVAIGLSMYFYYGVAHSKLDASSPQSTLLKSGNALPPTSWGSMENDAPPRKTDSQDKAPFPTSLSREILVDNVDTTP